MTDEAFMDEPMVLIPPILCSNRPKCTKIFIPGFPRTPRELITEIAVHGWTCERNGTRAKFTCEPCSQEAS